jgi:uncharacterized protein (DUF1330 family)
MIRYGFGISLVVAGMALGIGVGEVLHAQGTTPVFSVSMQGEVADAAKMQTISQELSAASAAAGAKPLARGGKVTVIEGENPGRVVIQQWPSMDAAMKFYNADRTKKLFEERKSAMKGTNGTFVTEGLAP